MANPSNPPVARFPVLPPLQNLQMTDARGYATIPFINLLQSIWAAIQGQGGLVDQTTYVLLNRDNSQASASSLVGNSPDLSHMPVSPGVQQQQITQLLQTISSVLGRISSLESIALLSLTSRPQSPSHLDGPYTVAMLPAVAPTGKTVYVTDATAPTYLGALVGAGTVVTPAIFNGTAWISF